MTQYARPASDSVAGGWTDEGTVDNDGSLYTSIDEITIDNDDSYINADSTGEVCVVKLGTITDPEVGTGHGLHIWFRSSGSAGPEKLDVRLIEDYGGAGTEICSVNNQSNRSGTYADINTDGYQLSEAEANLITDYGNLYVELTEDSVGSGEWIRITQVYFQAPDAVVTYIPKIIMIT